MTYKTFLIFSGYIHSLNQNNGPIEKDYLALNQEFGFMHQEGITKEDMQRAFPEEVWKLQDCYFKIGKLWEGPNSLFSRIFNAGKIVGTFDIMEDIYLGTVNPALSPLQQNWDKFIQSQVAATAVRHRKEEFLSLLSNFRRANILDVACGSGIASQWLYESIYTGDYAGVDSDINAIKFCRNMRTFPCTQYHHIRLNEMSPELFGDHDIVWCSGLFDYFSNDFAFKRGCHKLLNLSRNQVIIGNIGPANPSIPAMEALGWTLTYRSKAHLERLAEKVITHHPGSSYMISSDPTGVQHYLHLYK